MTHYSIHADLIATTGSLDTAWLVYPYWKSVLPFCDIEFNTFKFRPLTVRIIKEDFNN